MTPSPITHWATIVKRVRWHWVESLGKNISRASFLPWCLRNDSKASLSWGWREAIEWKQKRRGWSWYLMRILELWHGPTPPRLAMKQQQNLKQEWGTWEERQSVLHIPTGLEHVNPQSVLPYHGRAALARDGCRWCWIREDLNRPTGFAPGQKGVRAINLPCIPRRTGKFHWESQRERISQSWSRDTT